LCREILKKRLESIVPSTALDTQIERGVFYELLADLTNEDGAVVGIENLDNFGAWLMADVVLHVGRTSELLYPNFIK
jgi:hypothetical protein